jgi:hypothetical protein
MRKHFILTTIILGILLISAVSAEIWFVEQSVSEAGEQLEAELVCGDEIELIYLQHLRNDTSILISQPLTKEFVGNFTGRCKVELDYDDSVIKSQEFRISDFIQVETEIDRLNFIPQEEVIIRGEAEKENTQLLDGFFRIFIEKINLSTTGPVKGGRFEVNFSFPIDTPASTYTITITAYERKDEEILNTGETRTSVNVKSVPRTLDVALATQNIKPGNDLEFKILLYDQTGNIISGESSFLIEDSKGTPFLKNLIKIDESASFFVEKNFTSGYYTIKAYSSGTYGEREFYVEENEEVEFRVVNETLYIKNIGNVEYNKAIQVKIDEIVEIINEELSLAEEKRYQLKAPDGDYDIFITDGDSSVLSEGTALTGNAVNVKKLGGSFFARNKFLAWAFLILVMGMFIFTAARKALKKKFVLSEKPLGPGKLVKGAGVIKVGTKGKDSKVSIVHEPREAEHSLVLKGQKQEAAVVSLKIKNEISNTARQNLSKILGKAYDNKAVIYKSGDYSLIIFSPLITRTYKNHVPAVKLALDIAKILKDYNNKFSEKIDFGIAVHSGNIVNRLQDNKLKFTGLGNTLILAKKLAGISNQNVLLSKDVNSRAAPEVKAEKTEKEGTEVFTVDKVINTQSNKVFIQDFLKRLAEEGKKK